MSIGKLFNLNVLFSNIIMTTYSHYLTYTLTVHWLDWVHRCAELHSVLHCQRAGGDYGSRGASDRGQERSANDTQGHRPGAVPPDTSEYMFR